MFKCKKYIWILGKREVLLKYYRFSVLVIPLSSLLYLEKERSALGGVWWNALTVRRRTVTALTNHSGRGRRRRRRRRFVKRAGRTRCRMRRYSSGDGIIRVNFENIRMTLQNAHENTIYVVAEPLIAQLLLAQRLSQLKHKEWYKNFQKNLEPIRNLLQITLQIIFQKILSKSL